MARNETNWHGWGIGDRSIHVGRLPRRKRVCLYERTHNTVRPLAFFRTEKDAATVLAWLDKLAQSGNAHNFSLTAANRTSYLTRDALPGTEAT